MGRNTAEMIAYCGLDCHGCGIYQVTREEDPARKQKVRAELARVITETYGSECKPEDVTDCDGCKADTGWLFSGCKDCKIRSCASQKGLDNCAHCGEYPCQILQQFFATDAEARSRLDLIKAAL